MTGGRVRLGALVLPDRPGPGGVEVWRRVEDLGFDHAWTLDHLSWRLPPDQPWFDALTTLTAAAAVTSRIELGTLVVSPNFRHPVVTARQAMTLDHVSGGRFVLGAGAGAVGADSRALGGPALSPAEQAVRFEEFVSLTHMLLREPTTTFTGGYFSAHGVRMVPGSLRPDGIPLAVAATGPRGMRLVAEYGDTWITIGDARTPGGQSEREAFGTLGRQLDRLAAACEQVGRSLTGLRRLVNLSRAVEDPYGSPERLVELVGRCADMGFTDVVVAFPRREGVFAGDMSVFEEAVSRLRCDPVRGGND
ncbi:MULTISPECIES: LLM class flavin-dependent oxidoreductase [Streptomyces]|jgi:alkanesulfonate monooxygenase SsuD/methylene tetrahydromethanopterin reductase-like flavin-dependent oxidoreductase (luciferase family)|uniref:LLM class flavin-dependent oxidoreductase n=1 Tax=Streptomyces TaxID=1883 RepID=UPI001C30FEEA|nr:LLM class flavin-dependent oxidoreductase [Streptomyces sp. GbtcB7]